MKINIIDSPTQVQLDCLQSELIKEAKINHNFSIRDIFGGIVHLGATNNEKLIGVATINYHGVNVAELYKLYIHPKYRQLGIAKKLINSSIIHCKQNHFSELCIDTQGENQHFWKKILSIYECEILSEEKFSITI